MLILVSSWRKLNGGWKRITATLKHICSDLLSLLNIKFITEYQCLLEIHFKELWTISSREGRTTTTSRLVAVSSD